MPSYTPNIPQAADNPSNSQSQLLGNFQTLESLYGTSGDHYAWDNTNPAETAKHAKVTMPGLPTATAPGNLLPTPASGNLAIFAQNRNGQTTPFLTRDGLVPTAFVGNIWPLLPIKAYVLFSSVSTVITPTNIVPTDSFNIGPSGAPIVAQTQVAGSTVWTINLINACRTSTYGIIFITNPFVSNISYSRINTSQFTITVPLIGTVVGVKEFSIIVIEP